MEARKGYKSYAEAARRNESSEEEQSKEEWKRKESKSTKERERESTRNKDYDGTEEEIKKRDYGIALRGSVSEREEYLTSPSYTNLTSLSTTTRYMTEEVRNLCRIMERRLNLAEEMFLRFEDRQKKQQEEFFYKIT